MIWTAWVCPWLKASAIILINTQTGFFSNFLSSGDKLAFPFFEKQTADPDCHLSYNLSSGTGTVAFLSQPNSPNLHTSVRKQLNSATTLCSFDCLVAHPPPVPQRFLMWAGWQRTIQSSEARLVKTRSVSPVKEGQELLSSLLRKLYFISSRRLNSLMIHCIIMQKMKVNLHKTYKSCVISYVLYL